ncbi:hypothetical protein R1flu_021995 [Riccia fluitans]|uniref:Protein CHROMATIN REMODELING 5 n=1 Tax=Riccia fluitans TaxID=41844 RepID=A0ABD1ZQY6_9MARC
MPEYEEDGSDGDSGEEDSMANFMGEEERVEHSPGGNEEADDSTGNGIVHENDEGHFQSASEQENGESSSEREESDGSAVGDEESGKKLHGEEGFEYEADESGAVADRSFEEGRSLGITGNDNEEFPFDSREQHKDSDGDEVQEAGAPFKEGSESENEEYGETSYRQGSEERAREQGVIEANRQNDSEDEEMDEGDKEDEILGEIEEKDSDDDYEVGGSDDGSEYKGDDAETPARAIRAKQGAKPRYSSCRTNLINGTFAPSLKNIVHYASRPKQEKEEKEEEEEGHQQEDEEEDEEEEDDDEDEEEADDPEDEDFAPSTRSRSRGQTKVGNDLEESEEEEQDEDFEDDESLGLSDDSDDEYRKVSTRRKGRSTRSQQQPRLARDKVTNRSRRSTRTQRNVSYSEESESSAKDTDEDPDDEEYSQGQRTKPSFTRTRSTRHEIATSNSAGGRSRREKSVDAVETRTSRRAVPRKSYAEAEESEDEESQRAKKRAKVSTEDGEEEDGDAIEKVLWHQPIGIAEAEADEGRKAEPCVLDTDPNEIIDWEKQELYIKWKGQSYLHCQWQYLSELAQLSGYKKVVNYMKKIEDERSVRGSMSPEEAELHDVSKEMELDLLKQYTQVERVFASRTTRIENDDEVQEYLVKWKGLSYGESTWEKDTDISFALAAIDEYKAREALSSVQGKVVDAQRRKNKSTLRRLETQPEWLKGGTLRDYQLEGLNFLMISWRNDTNVILADEMGLGKTVQSVSMLGFLQYSQQIHGPFLVVVPLSTITNWAKEFRKWLPEMNVVVYVGNRASREMCQKYEFPTGRKSGRSIKFDTLLTTYEVVLKDKTVLEKIKWNYLMVDEAHRLKNSEAALYTTLSDFNAKNKCLVTGTPLQNSVEELWALLHFLDSEKFRSKEDFTEKYKNLNSFDDKELANLHGELRPHLLRRVIKDVEKSLPPKIERILRVEMSPLQKRYYKWILERNFQDLNKGVRGNNQVSLLNIVVELKKCCNHPFLFDSAENAYGGDSKHEFNKVQNMVLSSGKLTILDKLLIRLKETNHRVLIFSQMVKMLDILAEYLSLRGFQYQRLDGSTRADLRHQAMEHFNAPNSEDFCFLLSTRAGGLGINLATADTVIIFDSDWNPQNDLQAMSRAHRIGQQDVVNIYRFVTSKSVEEDILERAKKKMVLDHLVIQKLNAQGRLEKKETKKGSTMFDKSELAAILRFGAEELFKEEKNEEEGKSKLENMDIDEILARAEKVEAKDAAIEGENNELLSAFKVANFSNAEDDATFWSRLIPPEAAAQAQEETTQRAARKVGTYAEDTIEGRNSRKRRATDSRDRPSKRSIKAADVPVPQSIPLEGAAARVCSWDAGTLSKKDANAFVRVVKKFGDSSRMKMITKECGGAVESAGNAMQLQLFNNLINGCKEAVKASGDKSKAAVLDFFGVPVKAQEVLARVKELAVLAKRVKRYSDPVTQFRLKSHPKNPTWSKTCGWNQVDDARLLLGVHYHGLGNWEKIRTDDRLGLGDKIAPAGMSAAETPLPRATHLDARATALLRKELEEAEGGELERTKKDKAGFRRDRGDNHGRTESRDKTKERHGKSGQGHTRNPFISSSAVATRERGGKIAKEETAVKEEGEISDADNTPQPRRGKKNSVDKETKDGKWHDWCADMMNDQMRTLNNLHKLQTADKLSRDQLLQRVKKYISIVGRKVDEVLEDHAQAKNLERMAHRLWGYVSTFSSMTGERLAELYRKLKEAPVETSGGHAQSNAGPSGRETDHSHPGVPNHESRPRPSGRENDRVDGDAWEQHYTNDHDRESDAWQRRPWDGRIGVEGSVPGPAGHLYSVADRRKWEGRPGSSEGWERGAVRQLPGAHGVAFGTFVNGANGWAHDPRNRVPSGRGLMNRDRKWHGNDSFLHGRGGGRGL